MAAKSAEKEAAEKLAQKQKAEEEAAERQSCLTSTYKNLALPLMPRSNRTVSFGVGRACVFVNAGDGPKKVLVYNAFRWQKLDLRPGQLISFEDGTAGHVVQKISES